MENITEKQAKAVYGDLKSNENNRQVVTEGLAHATFKGDTFTRTSPSNSQLVQVEVPVGSMITTDIPQGTGSTSEHYVYCDPTPAGVAPFPSYQDDEAFYETPDDILLDRFYVFTPRGVVKARIVGTEINHRLGCVQYIVETKLPKGVRLHNGSKWIVEDYYYCWDELYATIEDAIDSI